MIRTGLILAAHGSGSHSSTNAQVLAFAARIGQTSLFDEVTPAFHRGEPSFAEALDGLTAEDVTVVPLMTSQGYYCDRVLPTELRKSSQFSRVTVRQTDPVGTHPGLVPMLVDRVEALIREHGLKPETTSLAIVGHGTPRHSRSREATIGLVEALRDAGRCADVLAAFLDEDPTVETIPARAAQDAILILPFLIGGGAHASVDIPRRISGSKGDRHVICDDPVGTYPGMVDLLIDLAQSGIRRKKDDAWP